MPRRDSPIHRRENRGPFLRKGGRGAQGLSSALDPPTCEESAALAAQMPTLAGCPLEAPLFVNTGWLVNQKFSMADDPDRTELPWSPPSFVGFRDPANQQTIAEDFEVGADPRWDRSESFARVVRHVLNEEDCAALVASVNTKGFTPALLNIGRGNQQLVPGARDGHRVIVDSPQFTDWLFQVLFPFLPARLADGSRLVGLNERCRFLCYTPGQQFPPHCDGCFERPRGHPNAGQFSYVTVQLYLHDVPHAHGGATTFMLPGKPKHQPEAGSALIFSQDLMHEGSLVERGIKYTLRTEAMYSRPEPRKLAPTRQIGARGGQKGAHKYEQRSQAVDDLIETWTCIVCDGTGLLLSALCPLCEGEVCARLAPSED